MADEIKEIVQITSVWTPEIIVNLIKEIVWPLTVLILGWRFRGTISNALSNFFSKNNMTELSATPTGVSAKFKVAQQSAETNEPQNNRTSPLPENASFESIQKRHSEYTTEYSHEIYLSIKHHIETLDINDEEKINLLETEAALLHSGFRYYDINKVLFRSQFNLFNDYFFDKDEVSIDGIKEYFTLICSKYSEEYLEWDYAKYMAYPITSGIIEPSVNGYKLTKLGSSYVKFMKRNLQLINELPNL